MPNLFGIDIKGIVANAIVGAGGLQSAKLKRVTAGLRDEDNPTRQAASTTKTYDVEVTVSHQNIREPNSAIIETRLVALLIAGTIVPAATPKVNDQLEVDGTTYTLTELVRSDPAGATYEFVVR